MKEYIVRLENNYDEHETYADKGENVAKVEVWIKGQEISHKNVRVDLVLSKDAKMGLGIALIRSALKEKPDEGHYHLRPVEKGLISQYCGIYLHPESCDLIISNEEFGIIENLFDIDNMKKLNGPKK